MLIGAGGLAALVHMISFSVLIQPSQQETTTSNILLGAVAEEAEAVAAAAQGEREEGVGASTSLHSVASSASAAAASASGRCL